MSSIHHQRRKPPGNSQAPPVVQSIFDLSADALGQIRTWLELNPPALPITQMTGFTQFQAQAAPFVFTAESTVSSVFGDLATVGPTLTGLPNGQYIFLYGCAAHCATGDHAEMSIQTNADPVSDNDAAVTEVVSTYTAIAIAVVKTLKGGSNTVTAKYRAQSGVSANFARRWLLALRYANA